MISKEKVRQYVKTLNYNMDLYNEYENYQIINRKDKISVEEYGADAYYSTDPINIYNIRFLDWYSQWLNLGTDRSSIPDYLSFAIYCKNRNISEYNEKKLIKKI